MLVKGAPDLFPLRGPVIYVLLNWFIWTGVSQDAMIFVENQHQFYGKAASQQWFR